MLRPPSVSKRVSWRWPMVALLLAAAVLLLVVWASAGDDSEEESAGRSAARRFFQQLGVGGSGDRSSVPRLALRDPGVGKRSIFIGMAAFRDNRCHTSIMSAFERADNPDRLRFGIFQQHSAQHDTDCLAFPCPGPHPVCKATPEQFRIIRIDYRDAKGPTWARHYADMLVQEDDWYAMQVDSHVSYAAHWDTVVEEQWLHLNNDYAVLATYVKGMGSVDDEGKAKDNHIVVVCRTTFKGAFKMPRHEPAGGIPHPFGKKSASEGGGLWPLLTPSWTAGLSFSRAHRLFNVPNDLYTPMIFDGEEYTLGARLWTAGYDFYCPGVDIVFHPYASEDPFPLPRYKPNPHEQRKSAQRINAVLGLPIANDEDSSSANFGKPIDVDYTDMEYLGNLGTYPGRSLEAFYDFTGIPSYKRGVTTNHDLRATMIPKIMCPKVFSGAFHKDNNPVPTGGYKAYQGPSEWSHWPELVKRSKQHLKERLQFDYPVDSLADPSGTRRDGKSS